MTVQIRLEGSAGNLTLTEDDIVRINPVLTHTGLGDFTATIAGNRNVEDFAARQDKILFDFNGETEFLGYLTNVEHTLSSGNTRLSGKGIAKRLQETRPDYESLGGPLTYSNIAVDDAIDDYWSRTEFSNYTVYDQPTETVATDQLIQDVDTQTEWEDILSPIDDTTPLVIQSGELTRLQPSFVTTAEELVALGTTTAAGFSNQDGYNNGELLRFINIGEYAEFDITLDYTIPTENDINKLVPNIRGIAEGGAGINFGTFEVSIDGTKLGEVQISDDLEWDGLTTATTEQEYVAGTYTVRFELIDRDASDTEIDIDVFQIGDDRYTYTFDNTLSSTQGYLDGPELYPSISDSAETVTFGTSFNITASDVTTVSNDTSRNQAISVSNTGGDSYTTFDNTDTVSHSYSTDGREARVRFTIGRTDDTRTGETPLTGYEPQTVDSFEHRVDGNNKSVIVELELSKSHFDNLQTLHEKGDYQFTIEHDDLSIANLVVESYSRGDQSRTLPLDNEIESTPAIAAGNYFNSIYLQGQLVNGSRPVAEISDSDRVSQDGREISPGVLRDLDISTEAGAAYRARTLLERAKTNNALRGQKTYPADFSLQVGYAYEVSFGEGPTELTAEEISLSLGTNQATVTLDFVPPTDLSEDISELRRQARQLEDRV